VPKLSALRLSEAHSFSVPGWMYELLWKSTAFSGAVKLLENHTSLAAAGMRASRKAGGALEKSTLTLKTL